MTSGPVDRIGRFFSGIGKGKVMRLFHRELGSRTDNAKWLSREGRRYKGSGFTSDRVVTIGIPTRAGGAGRKERESLTCL